MREVTTENRKGVYIVTTPDQQEHRTIRAGFRMLMQNLRSCFPGAMLAVRFEEVQSVAMAEIINLTAGSESFQKLAC